MEHMKIIDADIKFEIHHGLEIQLNSGGWGSV
jgi:hypothetical protein